MKLKLLMVLSLAAIVVGCGYSKSTTPPTPAAMPTISNLNPSSTAVMGPQFSLEVSGTNFAAGAVVNFNHSPMTTVADTGKLKATIPASAITTAGQVPVTVTNPGHAGGGIYGSGGTSPTTSAASTFTINP